MSILHFIPTRVNQKLINLHKRVYFTVKKGNIEFLKKWTHEFLQTWFGLHIKKILNGAQSCLFQMISLEIEILFRGIMLKRPLMQII
jgi:hypothetical protein